MGMTVRRNLEPFLHCDDGIHITFLMGRQRVGDDVRSSCIIELYQHVVEDMVS